MGSSVLVMLCVLAAVVVGFFILAQLVSGRIKVAGPEQVLVVFRQGRWSIERGRMLVLPGLQAAHVLEIGEQRLEVCYRGADALSAVDGVRLEVECQLLVRPRASGPEDELLRLSQVFGRWDEESAQRLLEPIVRGVLGEVLACDDGRALPGQEETVGEELLARISGRMPWLEVDLRRLELREAPDEVYDLEQVLDAMGMRVQLSQRVEEAR